MGNYKRRNVGSIYKSKDKNKSDYLKVNLKPGDPPLVLNNGDILQIETKEYQLKNLEQGREAGRVSDDTYEKALERINNIPDYVRASVVQSKKVE